MANVVVVKSMSSFSINPKFTSTCSKLPKPKLIRVRLYDYHKIKTKDIHSWGPILDEGFQ